MTVTAVPAQAADSGVGGGGFDYGGGSFDDGSGRGYSVSGPVDPIQDIGGAGAGGMHAPGSRQWMHQQHVHHNAHMHGASRRSSGSLPTSPLGIALFVIVAIVALMMFANFSSGADDVFPGAPYGEVVDGGTVDGGFDVPPAP